MSNEKKCPFCSGAIAIPKQNFSMGGIGLEVTIVTNNCIKENCMFWNSEANSNTCKIMQIIDLVGTKTAIDLKNQIEETQRYQLQ